MSLQGDLIMAWNQLKRKSRDRLDRRFKDMPTIDHLAAPPQGWAKAIREALGFSARQLGQRISTSAQAVQQMEKNEALGRIQLDSLAQLARAMDCHLVYAIVPNNAERSLQKMVEDRARQIALKTLAPVTSTMALEDQAVDLKDELRLQYFIQENLGERQLWEGRD
jgi:predicted DNA-binding mobile mystery protein A